ncbi:MAG TPA: ATP-binding protein [Saprospiraceae bacterium]|nr:ATP-binding protein [Saprospiraceae bacterium]
MRSTHLFQFGFLSIILTLICNTNLYCQQGRLLFHHLGLEDGLSELTNQYVYKDSEGFIWISSLNGLNRFDGTTVKRYLPNPEDTLSIYGDLVQSNFFEDTSSCLWFSTYNAVNCYNRKHDCFYHYRITDSIPHRLTDYNVFYFDPNHQLWLTTDDSTVYTFNINTHTFHAVEKLKNYGQRSFVIPDHQGFVNRIFTYSQTSTGIIELQFGENENVMQQTVMWTDAENMLKKPRKIVPGGDSVVWIAAEDNLVRYNFINKTEKRLPLKGILTIEPFMDSILLVSIDKKGVFEFNTNRFSFGHLYRPENDNSLSLLSNKIEYISKDVDQGYWFSEEFGVSYAYARKKKFNSYNPVSKTGTETSDFNATGFIIDHSGRILCHTNAGIFELDKEGSLIRKIETKDPETVMRMEAINSIFEDSKHRYWVSSFSGLSLLSSTFATIRNFKDILIEGINLGDGQVLFSRNDSGLFELDGNSDSMRQIKPNVFKTSYLNLFKDQRGRLWMNEGLEHFIILEPITYNILARIPISGLWASMLESGDGHSIWIASTSGLYNVDAENLAICNVYKEVKGFSFVGLNSLLMDKKDELWISSNIGIIHFNPETEATRLYTYEDGLPASNFNPNAAYQFPNGEMWFGSSQGITKFKPDELNMIDIHAIPQITALLINDQPLSQKLICEETQNTNIAEIKKLTFSYLDRTLTFIVNSLEFSAPKKNKIKYWMEGIDADSIETSSGSRIRYPNLPAGKFTFCIQAANSDGEYNPFVRKMEIIIKPPFYKTPWFMLLAVLITMGPVAYIIYLRISKKLELQKVRLGLYENLHDDVGSRLMAIVMTAEEIVNQDKSTNPKIRHISTVAKSIVGNMKRLVWAIDPENESMNSLIQKIRYDKSLILADDTIAFHLESAPELDETIVPGEIRYQITSIVNEALNNISKYARAQNVWIQFTKKEKELVMLIRDDGIGFNTEQVINDKVKSSGYGLGNMEKRVSRVKGHINVDSKPGEGTTIMVRIPFK